MVGTVNEMDGIEIKLSNKIPLSRLHQIERKVTVVRDKFLFFAKCKTVNDFQAVNRINDEYSDFDARFDEYFQSVKDEL